MHPTHRGRLRGIGRPNLCGGLRCFVLGLQGEDEAVFADGEADAGSFGAAEHFAEAVVAAAAEQGVLRAQAAAIGNGELEGGAGVVVEAADQARVDGVGQRRRRPARRGPGEVGAGVGVEVVGDFRAACRSGPGRRALC